METAGGSGENAQRVVCGIAGSLRAGSFNRGLLRAARDLAPPGMELRVFDRVGDVPLYNADVEAAADPEGVRALKEAIASADGVLFVTPEYNAGVPGVMKNLVDWASRPHDGGDNVLKGTPAAVMGTTTGRLGTARSQAHLRISLASAGAVVMAQPQVHVMGARDRFVDGELADETIENLVSSFLAAFSTWIDRFV